MRIHVTFQHFVWMTGSHMPQQGLPILVWGTTLETIKHIVLILSVKTGGFYLISYVRKSSYDLVIIILFNFIYLT